MKHTARFVLAIASISLVAGCAGLQKSELTKAKLDQTSLDCPGTVELPLQFSNIFDPVSDDALLETALGMPEEGKLCQAKVYQVKTDASVTLYRAWNSTNEKSRFGQWWAFTPPEGKVARYRSDYEICYQWSPLDKMTQCDIKAGSKVVIGTGQSAKCSEYLSYPASPVLQIYIADAKSISDACRDFNGIFNWEPVELK